MIRLISSLSSTVGEAWCQFMHPDPMWPVKGEYQCRTCFRKYPVSWEAQPEQTAKIPKQQPATVRARIVS